MVKISKVFVLLVAFGGAGLALLFLHSTLSPSSEYQEAPEVKRENIDQRSLVHFSLKKYKSRLSERVPNHPLLVGSPVQWRFPSPVQPVGLSKPVPNGLGQSLENGIDTNFVNHHRPFVFKQPAGVELEAAAKLATRFPFRSDFSFPQPKVMKTLDYIKQVPWIIDLRHYLSSYNHSREISLVTSNSKYIDVLLNWLISATVKSGIPAKTILIISLDKAIHKIMLAKQFCSILVYPRSLIDPNVKFSEPFEEVMMTRLAMMRIINHFGYSFVMYDSDAVILKDPQPLYDAIPHEDIIGSVGKIPYDLAAEWGITICIGVVLVRSSSKTETYWNSMKDVCFDSVDDQEKLNCGLKALDISWLNNDSNYQDTTVRGVCSNDLQVSILPYDNICRQLRCIVENRSSYFIWHKGGQRSRRDKLISAREGQTWFLKYQWEKIQNTLMGTRWLESIAYYTVLHA